MPYTIFKAPGIDARVAIAIQGTLIAISLLAKGRSRKADRTYVLRNPERRALWLQVLESLRTNPTIYVLFALRATRGGKSDSPIKRYSGINMDGARKAYSASGNYRYDLVIDSGVEYSLNDLTEHLGLVPDPTARPPKDVRWLR